MRLLEHPTKSKRRRRRRQLAAAPGAFAKQLHRRLTRDRRKAHWFCLSGRCCHDAEVIKNRAHNPPVQPNTDGAKRAVPVTAHAAVILVPAVSVVVSRASHCAFVRVFILHLLPRSMRQYRAVLLSVDEDCAGSAAAS